MNKNRAMRPKALWKQTDAVNYSLSICLETDKWIAGLANKEGISKGAMIRRLLDEMRQQGEKTRDK